MSSNVEIPPMLERLVLKPRQMVYPNGRSDPLVELRNFRQVPRRTKDIVLVAGLGEGGANDGGPRVGSLPDTLASKAVKRRLSRPHRGFGEAPVLGAGGASRRAGETPSPAAALWIRARVP